MASRAIRSASDARVCAAREQEAVELLRGVHDPLIERDVVSCGMARVRADMTRDGVDVVLELRSAAHPERDRLREQCARALRDGLPWARDITVELRAACPSGVAPGGGAPGLERVGAAIAVSSCKGGVGKSTVAVNLAYSLARRGGRVGLLDADVYGPSLPSLISPADVAPRPSRTHEGMVLPIEHRGVRCVSFGYVNSAAAPGAGGRGAAVMRGSIVSRVINQLATSTDWGELDYLVIDMPPGTGDIQLTLSQNLVLTGAVIVTTPHPLSHIDVVKGVDMFRDLKVPPLAVVENMAYFECDGGARHYPFGRGLGTRLRDEIGVDAVFELPLSQAIGDANAYGEPLVLAETGRGAEAAVYDALAREVIVSTYRQQYRAPVLPVQIEYQPARGIVLRSFDADAANEYTLMPRDVRKRDPRSGLPLEDGSAAGVPDDVVPTRLAPKGGYGVAIDWSDGHRGSIYLNSALLRIAREPG